MSENHWSTFPRQHYTVWIDGERYGLGVHPAFEAAPGAWNILQLVWPGGCDDAHQRFAGGEPRGYPYAVGFIAFAVGLAWQEAKLGVTWGELAEKLSPREFTDQLRRHPNRNEFILPGPFPEFFDKADALVAEYEARRKMTAKNNVFFVDFGGATQ